MNESNVLDSGLGRRNAEVEPAGPCGYRFCPTGLAVIPRPARPCAKPETVAHAEAFLVRLVKCPR